MGIPKCWIIIYSSYTWNKEKSLPSTRHIQAYTMLAEWDDSQGKPKCPRHLWGWHVQRRGDRHGRGPPASPYGDTTWEQHRTAANLRWFQWGNTKNNNQNVKQLELNQDFGDTEIYQSEDSTGFHQQKQRWKSAQMGLLPRFGHQYNSVIWPNENQIRIPTGWWYISTNIMDYHG